MASEVGKLRLSLKRQIAAPELLEMERFLLHLEVAKSLDLSEDEKMGLACVYHQARWFWSKQAKKYFSKDRRLSKLSIALFPEYHGAAERSLENLLARNGKLADTMNVPPVLAKSIANANTFLKRKEAASSRKVKNNKLSAYKFRFDDKTATLHVGGIKVPIPPNTNQHNLLKTLFVLRRDEIVSWDEIYEAMTGNLSEATNKQDIDREKRAVRDTIRAINRKVQSACNTDDLLLRLENKGVRRRH